MKPELHLNQQIYWTYQTDDMEGVCIIAKDKMTINFKFEAFTKDVYDVLKLDEMIKLILKVPVSVESAQQELKEMFPDMKITVRGRAESHGWIEAQS